MIWIIANSAPQADNFAKEKNLALHEWRYLYSPDELRGKRLPNDVFVRVGDPRDDKDIKRRNELFIAAMRSDMMEVLHHSVRSTYLKPTRTCPTCFQLVYPLATVWSCGDLEHQHLDETSAALCLYRVKFGLPR